MINFILTYLLLGTLYMWFMEWLADYFIKTLKDHRLKKQITTPIRVTTIIIWPIGLTIFLYNFIKTKYRL
jgi:peptidoglycan biosynthesis protein MviN/MurJ (putative lipid II flippase)